MTTVRCYIPLGTTQLESLRDERRLTGPLRATAVTADLRAADPAADEEEAEYAAAQEAATLTAGGGESVILAAADLTEDSVTPVEGAWVTVRDVALPRVAALHLGDDVVTGDRSTLPAEGEELELSWYDTTELEHVIELARAAGAPPTP